MKIKIPYARIHSRRYLLPMCAMLIMANAFLLSITFRHKITSKSIKTVPTQRTNYTGPVFSPYLPLQACARFLPQAHIFHDFTTPYTKFYPFSTVKFAPSYHTQLCADRDVYVLVGIMSRRRSSGRRIAARNTFASLAACDDKVYARHNLTCDQLFHKFRVVFFVGNENYAPEMARLVHETLDIEKTLYNDIVEIDIEERYSDLTTKTLAFLQWATEHCAGARYVLKSDDDNFLHLGNLYDVVVSVESLLQQQLQQQQQRDNEVPQQQQQQQLLQRDYELQHLQEVPHFIVGDMRYAERPERDPRSSWYVPWTVYPDERLPNYVVGCGYLMPLRTAKLLYEAGRCVQTTYIEDVFLTGLLSKSLGVKRLASDCINCKRFTDFSLSGMVNDLAQLGIRHRVNERESFRAWKGLVQHFEKVGELDLKWRKLMQSSYRNCRSFV